MNTPTSREREKETEKTQNQLNETHIAEPKKRFLFFLIFLSSRLKMHFFAIRCYCRFVCRFIRIDVLVSRRSVCACVESSKVKFISAFLLTNDDVHDERLDQTHKNTI